MARSRLGGGMIRTEVYMLVFVYGSLKRGYRNHRVMQGAKFVGEDEVRGFAMLNLGTFPGVVPSTDGLVKGEVYEVDDAHVARLDRFEGCPNFYRRESCELVSGCAASVYVLSDMAEYGRPVVKSGVWTEGVSCAV